MAGDWIKVRTRLLEDPAVFRMSDLLGLSVEAVGGHLLRVWSWATDQVIDGNAPGVTRTHLDRIACVTGMGSALESVGWITFTDTGATFPNWERHLAQGAKARALTALRVQKSRNGASVTEALPEKRREEKRRDTAAAAISPTAGETADVLASFGIASPAREELAALGLTVAQIRRVCESCKAHGKGVGVMVLELRAAADQQTASKAAADSSRAILERFRPVWAALGQNRLQAKETYLTANPAMRQYTGGPLEDLPRFQQWVIGQYQEVVNG